MLAAAGPLKEKLTSTSKISVVYLRLFTQLASFSFYNPKQSVADMSGLDTARPDSRSVDTMDHAVATPKSDELFRNHRALIDWLTKDNQGYLFPDVRIAHSPSKGFHLIVAESCVVEAETRIVSCPMPATMSVLNALDIAPFSCHGTKFPKTFLDNNVGRPEVLQTFFLMEQFLMVDTSWWAAYIKTLPTPTEVDELQFETGEDLAWLEGTNLKGGFATQTTKWQDMYSKALRELKILGWPRALHGEYSWDLFRWAATMFGSRSFTSEVLADTEPADRARMSGRMCVKRAEHIPQLFTDRFAVLLPLLDILNHRPIAQVEWQARSTFVGLQVLDRFNAGQELCNNYGPRENEGLLMSYGFTIEGNPFDHVGISLRIPAGSPIEDARKWEKDIRSHLEHKAFIFGADHYKTTTAVCLETALFSYDLLDSLSMLKANDREFTTMYSAEKTLMSRCLEKPHQFEDFRNLLSVLSQLLQDCRAGARRLQLTYPSRPPQNQRQENAKVYRDSQQLIYETAAATCFFVLLKACSGFAEDDLVTAVGKCCSSTAHKSMSILLEQKQSIVKTNELLSSLTLSHLLAPDTVNLWRQLLDDVRAELKRLKSLDIAHDVRWQKTSFAVLLSAAYSEYERGISTPSRLRQWLHQLSQWYPPEDPNWSYVPTSGPWPPGQEPPMALVDLLRVAGSLKPSASQDTRLKAWLEPSRICWAWNVMEEEGVLVPNDIGTMAYLGSDMEGPLGFLLYCKHY